MAENLLERLRSEEEPSAETLAAARVVGRRMRTSGASAALVLRREPAASADHRGVSAAKGSAEPELDALRRAIQHLERDNAALRRERDEALAERRAAESRAEALRAELARAAAAGWRAAEGAHPATPDGGPPRPGSRAREHAERTYWRIEAIRRAAPRASLHELAEALNQQGWSTAYGLPWTRDSVRHLIRRVRAA